jgi:hypothetical protein
MKKRKAKYQYQAFGLKIQSVFEIPEFLPAEFEAPDVEIYFENVPSYLDEIEKKGLRYRLNQRELLLNLDHVADYYVKEGKQILIQKKEESTLQEVRLFLVGIVFSALLHQRGTFALHASALRKADECFLVAGNSGAGKSTLTREFLNDGYQVLSDDIGVLEKMNDVIQVKPAFPFIKLWKDSIEHLELDKMEGKKLREQMDKYGFGLSTGKEFYTEELPVKKIFILTAHNQAEYKSEKLKGIDKFNALKNNTYRFQFIANKVRPSHFELINYIANQIPVYRITRPQAPINPKGLKDYIEKILNEG